MANTPAINSKGKFNLLPPWSTAPNMLYTCVGIRMFGDLYLLGKDVYKTIYEPMGVIEGSTTYTPTPFVFKNESKNKVKIVTLEAEDGTVIYVPDSFIASQPTTSDVNYKHVVLSFSLSAIPDNLDLSAIKTNVANLVGSMIGINPIVYESSVPSFNTPTPAQHLALEAARNGAVTLQKTDRSEAIRQSQEVALLNAKIESLTTILRNNGLLPT